MDGEGAPAPPARAERAEEARPLALYVERARVAGVEVELLDRGSLPAKLARLLDDLGSPVTACPAQRWPAGLWEEVEAALRRAGCRVIRPEPAPGGYAWERESLSGAALGITPCEVYLAETGSLVFPAGAGQGTLASLLPPMHLALSVPGRCLRDLGEYLALPLALPSRLQLVTGPSRTGDIEGTLSTGVHGPGRVLHWIVGAA